MEEETPAWNGREVIDDFRLGGQGRGVVWVATLQRGGGSPKWLTQVAHAVDHHNASLSEGPSSLLWSGPCLESLMGHRLARIPRIGCDNCGGAAAGVSPRRPMRRAWRGRKWRERPRVSWRWCATGEG